MSPRDGVGRAARASTSLGAIVLAALIPKCPMCIAAALSVVGIGTTLGSSIAPIVRPVGIALAVLALALFARAEWRRRTQRGCAGTCERGARDGVAGVHSLQTTRTPSISPTP